MSKYNCGHETKVGYFLSRPFKNFTLYWYRNANDVCFNCFFKKHKVLFWEYGECKDRFARRHRLFKNVQFVLWKAGEQNHKKDYWHNFDESWWVQFKEFV